MSTVQLYRYDLTDGMAKSMAPMMIGKNIEAIWHTSIVAFGNEFYFGGGESVMKMAPGTTRFGTPLRTEELGTTKKTMKEFETWINEMKTKGFGEDDYDLLKNNCNDFTQAASQFLLGKDIPEDIRKLLPELMATPLGGFLAPILQKAASTP